MKTILSITMNNLGDYPAGASNDKCAPYNQDPIKERSCPDCGKEQIFIEDTWIHRDTELEVCIDEND